MNYVDEKDRKLSNYFDQVADKWDSNPLKVERAKLTAKKIKEVNFGSFHRLIDFGSGTGLLGMQLSDVFNEVHLIDSSSEMLNIAKTKIKQAGLLNIQTHDVNRLSALALNCSVIATLMTLHHVENIYQFFADAYNTLEDNGVLIIADLYLEDGSFHKHNPLFNGHNGFDILVLSDIAKQNGFVVDSAETYYEIWQENFEDVRVSYPLFFFVARK
ncbi:class I SAM-dependent DNA methyltransferase [Psychromonas sp. PT13]|uniref:class I SAM-dependent DNA methyltransferase n=1 Tax=Psychromonas sp. PT13 TaxID=3439547 RepID=UPI003EB89D2D